MKRMFLMYCLAVTLMLTVIFHSATTSYAQDQEEPNLSVDVDEALSVQTISYAHSESSSANGVTLKVEWNDPVAGQPMTFHVSGSDGSGEYKFRMDAPSYSNPNEYAYESVADPSRGVDTIYW